MVQVHDRHRSREFIELLTNTRYTLLKRVYRSPDFGPSFNSYLQRNHEIPSFQAGRFLYLHTLQHQSWFNLIESVCSKMAWSFLRHIRISSKKELKQQILPGDRRGQLPACCLQVAEIWSWNCLIANLLMNRKLGVALKLICNQVSLSSLKRRLATQRSSNEVEESRSGQEEYHLKRRGF